MMSEGDELVEEPFRRLIAEKRLFGYRHEKFWTAMDTIKDKNVFDEMYATGNTSWQIWSKARDA